MVASAAAFCACGAAVVAESEDCFGYCRVAAPAAVLAGFETREPIFSGNSVVCQTAM